MLRNQQPSFIMTIDGPGGSGKDTLAENLVVSDIFFPHSVRIFNSGDYARSIAAGLLHEGLLPTDSLFREMALCLMDKINFAHVDQSPLFSAKVEDIISDVAGISEIRDGFAEKLPEIIRSIDTDVIIILGRVTGALCPNADLRLFLETSANVCAHRRAIARSLKGEDYDTIKTALDQRNKSDSSNWQQPLPAGTIIINTDEKTEIEVFREVVDYTATNLHYKFC